ncbi:hypothetical protein HK096_006397, partial [Nowakowskiella sp. JEL0078]
MSIRTTKSKRIGSRTEPSNSALRSSVANVVNKEIAGGKAASNAGVQATIIANKRPTSENDTESSSTSNNAFSSKSVSEAEAPKFTENVKFYQQQTSYQDFDDNGSDLFTNDTPKTSALEYTEEASYDIGQSIMYASVQQSDLVLNPWEQDNGPQSPLILDPKLKKLTLDSSPSLLRASSHPTLNTWMNSSNKKNDTFETSSTYSYAPQSSNDLVYSPKQFQSSSEFPVSKPLSKPATSPPPRFDSVDPWSGKPISIGGSGTNKQNEINQFVSTNTQIDIDGPFGIMSPNHDPQDGVQWFENLDVVELQISPEKGGYILKY